ncbi:hypothetical protein MSPP1_002163 [Malassezia sp. CBS 17886]|nr:hypothetical protein MSPP1_002163 [Malassezia sp. CBS 17886]
MLSVPSLIDCWHVRDLPHFRRVLRGNPAERASAPQRSPSSFGSCTALALCAPAEVNRRDHFGRSVLHLLAASADAVASDFLHVLFTHPSVNCNLQDHESGWTPLHRALYAGNLGTVISLLRRPDIDTHVRDYEGLTPFDLYNLTVPNTAPAPGAHAGDLHVWGGNRNFQFGLGHCDDCALPERVRLPHGASAGGPATHAARVMVKDIAMSRWHTVLLTNEPRANVYVCGIGSGGRLGRMPQTQTTLAPLRDFSECAAAVALGPDHTLLVTAAGAVYTCGTNRMAQLGYTVEEGLGTVSSSLGTARASGGAPYGTSIGPQGAALDIQVTPRRVLGVLKREAVLGAAVSRLHSAVFTTDALYTWGTNTGQLGYDRHAAPVQVQPRKVTAVGAGIRHIAASDFATACLLESGDVLVFHGDTHFRIVFPLPRAAPDMSMFRPRHTQSRPTIATLTCAGTTFAALSGLGDLFTFSLGHPTDTHTRHGRPSPPRPQLVWSVRRKFSAVRDVAIGTDGTIVLCTASGHVFVRMRKGDAFLSKAAASRALKFQKVPFLQRIVRVELNECGGFAALQAPTSPAEIPLLGVPVEDALLAQLPLLAGAADVPTAARVHAPNDSDEEGPDAHTLRRQLAQADLLLRRAAERGDALRGPLVAVPPPFAAAGCDMLLDLEGEMCLPVHRVLWELRVRRGAAGAVCEEPRGGTRGGPAHASRCDAAAAAPAVPVVRLPISFLAALFLVHYVYTDQVPPVWTSNLRLSLEPLAHARHIDTAHVLGQLRTAAAALGLDALQEALAHTPTRAPEPQLRAALQGLYGAVCAGEAANTDVVLHLADGEVRCHALFLRRSPMFQALFAWHRSCGRGGDTHVDLTHHRWGVVRVALAFMYTDADERILGASADGVSVDAHLDFVTDVLQLADELLLEKLQLLCVNQLRPRVRPANVGALLTDAYRYNARPFEEACMEYCACIMETLLESRLLDELLPTNLARLTAFVQRLQDRYLSRTLASDRILALTLKHHDFLQTVDIPEPSLNLACLRVASRAKKPARGVVDTKPTAAADAATLTPPSAGDSSLLFDMDDVGKADAWQTVRQPRTTPKGAARAPPDTPTPDAGLRMPDSPALMPPLPRRRPLNLSGAERAASASGDASPRSASTGPPPAHAMRELAFAPATPSHARHLAPSPPSASSVSSETQEALASMPLAIRVSQKARKKQQRVAVEYRDGGDARTQPVWGRDASSRQGSAESARRSGECASPPPASRESHSPAQTQAQSSSSLSFLQIQEQQLQAVHTEQTQQQQKSFAEILEEERRASQRERDERAQAEQFDRWFEEESRRVQAEAAAAQSPSASAPPRQKPGRHRRGAATPPRQRSRGRGRQDPADARIDDQ